MERGTLGRAVEKLVLGQATVVVSVQFLEDVLSELLWGNPLFRWQNIAA